MLHPVSPQNLYHRIGTACCQNGQRRGRTKVITVNVSFVKTSDGRCKVGIQCKGRGRRRYSGTLSYMAFHQLSSPCSHLANQAKMVFCHLMRLL